METPISSHKTHRDSTAGESVTSIIVTKNAEIVDVFCRFFRRLCLVVGGRDDGGLF